jgi:hypothetical protein
MDLTELSRNYRPATERDIPRLVTMANHDPSSIWVRDLFFGGSPFPLSDVASAPFLLDIEAGSCIMCGTDKTTGAAAKLRFRGDVVEIKNDYFNDWTSPSMGGIRIYVPNQ